MKTLLLSLAALLLLATCTKPDPLPPVTEVGAHTFGCRIDGKPYVPDGGTGWNAYSAITLGYIDLLGGRYLSIETVARDGRSFFLLIKDATQPGLYKVDQDAKPFTNDPFTPGYMIYSSSGTGYITNAQHTGWFNLTRCDTARKIYSGTFAFQAYNTRLKESVTVTDGRFDLDFNKQKR
jgi:hypothetical protein